MDELIELLAYLAQQIQTGLRPDGGSLAYIRQVWLRGGSDADLLKATIKSLDVPQLERLLRKGQPSGVAPSPGSTPGKTITLYKVPLPAEAQARVAADSLIARYLSWLARNPHRRAVSLAESDRHVVLFVPEGSEFDPDEAWREFVAFVFSGEELIRTFVAMLNSIQLSDRGFGVPEFPLLSQAQQLILLAWLLRGVRSVEKRLTGRDTRITELEASLNNLGDKERKKVEKEIQDLRGKQDKESKKYTENFSRRFSGFLRDQLEALHLVQECETELSGANLKPAQYIKLESKRRKAQLKVELAQDQLLKVLRLYAPHSGAQLKVELAQDQLLKAEELLGQTGSDPIWFLKQFADQHQPIFDRAHALMELFTERAARQINLTRGDNFANAVVEIVRLTSWLECTDGVGAIRAQKFNLRPLLLQNSGLHNKHSPGDGTGEFCYVCGELLTPEDEAQVNRFIFRSPSQRLQSVRGEQRPPVCRHCVAVALVSPLKPSDQSVIIRFEPIAQDGLGRGRSAAVLGKLNSFLRGLTLSQLDLAAGNYLMLTSNERVKVGNKWRPLSDVVGTVVYAYLRLSDLFDHQIFTDYKARIVTGISDIELEPHRLTFLSILIKSLQLHLTEGSDINRPLATAARYVLADEPILAIYELFRLFEQLKGDEKESLEYRLARKLWKLIQEQKELIFIQIEKSLEVWTKMIGGNRAKMIADVIAMAGLLYPFVEQTLREVRKKNDTSLDPNREASKLIEEVDEVFNFIYRFADNTAYSTARLYRNPINWFTYEQTKALLERLGIRVSEREKTENGSRFLEVNTNDVEAAYKKFAEEDYKGDADWKAFTYRLKLALYSRFPGLGVKKEKPE
jgi:hypothetical protein